MASPTEVPAAPAPQPLSEKARGKLPMGAPVPLSVVQNGVGPAGGAHKPPPSATRSVRFSTQPQSSAPLTDVHRRARLRLLPLLTIESELTRKLFPELAASTSPSTSPTPDQQPGAGLGAVRGAKEVCVRAGSGWKEVLLALQKEKRSKGTPSPTEELTTVLDACREDIVGMWDDQAVKAMLRRRGVRLQDMPGL